VGTNYYYHEDGERKGDGLHIGKSSTGWNFSLRIHPDQGIDDLASWRDLWAKGGAIFDEYDRPVTAEQMLSTITERHRPGGLLSCCDPVNMGPYGHDLDVRPGEGTYDLCNYEFS
jgi:hypothetical protein